MKEKTKDILAWAAVFIGAALTTFGIVGLVNVFLDVL